MTKENKILMQEARDALKGKWGLAIGTSVIYLIIVSIPSGIHGLGGLISLIIGGPFAMGVAVFSLAISRNQEARVEQIFEGFNYFSNTLVTYLLVAINVFIRLILLIVPGIIAALAYAMTFYILADNPELRPKEAMEKSKVMMDGYKLKLFYMGLWFFGLALLCILTLGIGFFWWLPFVNVCMAKFYDDIKTN